MVKTATLGYPRIGHHRELKKATESFWKGEITEKELNDVGLKICKENWSLQEEIGIDFIPSNDFSFYDHILDINILLGAIPERFKVTSNQLSLSNYFAMARGAKFCPAMEMTKWFDTNYHYIVPEFSPSQDFKLMSNKPFDEYNEAKNLGIKTRPVLIGPMTYLMLGKFKGSKTDNFNKFNLIEHLISGYNLIFEKFKVLGVDWIQIDEPVLVMDLDENAKNAFRNAYSLLQKSTKGLNLMLTTYFGDLGENLNLACSLPVNGIHFDLVRGSKQPNDILAKVPKDFVLSLGVIDGRNIWKTDIEKVLKFLSPVLEKRNTDNLIIAPSCSFLHIPQDLELEKELDDELKNWLAFAKQKLKELVLIKKVIEKGKDVIEKELEENKLAVQSRKTNKRIHVDFVKERIKNMKPGDCERKSSHDLRQKLQREKLKLPLFPTTTIGSFPQTKEIREIRAKLKNGLISLSEYNEFIKEKIKEVIYKQDEIGLDVLVHGEPERNDMVEYFGEMLHGFAFTKNAWVQSYGTRCVKPPIIYGDVYREKPMTLEWIKYAQSLTNKPLKGMLTGPITILQWSFVRDDQERSLTATQIALALRDEVSDLEKAGILIVQIDEPAIREGLPLHKLNWNNYLEWAVDCFKLASSCVKDETQIHTHMCYSEFNDIIESIARMDADVISIEASHSQMELLNSFHDFKYPNEIGPGVYDVHSPSVPKEDEIKDLIEKACKVLPPKNIWVNPDCGLKTRGWEETDKSLKAMVNAAKSMREVFSARKA